MIDLTSKEEALKHIQHIKNTFGNDLEEPLKIYKSDYRLEMRYLNNLIYLIDTSTLDMKIDDFLKGDEKESERKGKE